MCLTGVDYFSTLAYQPSIAFMAAGVLSPVATFVLIVLTLLGALPMYSRIATMSPHGQGSILMLEDLFPKWAGKVFVLCLLGFAATDFVITITLSAADATAHLVENPFTPPWLDHPMLITLLLLFVLGLVFLRGFGEAITLAVVLVVAYLSLNVVVIGVSLHHIWAAPRAAGQLEERRCSRSTRTRVTMLLMAMLLFPKLALGLSGFETGVAVMPLVRGDDDRHRAGAARANPQHQETARHGGADHERDADGQQPGHGRHHSGRGVSAAPAGRRPRARLPGARTDRHRLRHGLRHRDDRDSLVRGGFGDGRAAEPRAALSAAIRHGAGMGARDPAAGRAVHRHHVPRDDHLRRQRGCPGRRLRDRRAGAHELGGARRRDHGVAAAAPLHRLRGRSPWCSSTPP